MRIQYTGNDLLHLISALEKHFLTISAEVPNTLILRINDGHNYKMGEIALNKEEIRFLRNVFNTWLEKGII